MCNRGQPKLQFFVQGARSGSSPHHPVLVGSWFPRSLEIFVWCVGLLHLCSLAAFILRSVDATDRNSDSSQLASVFRKNLIC